MAIGTHGMVLNGLEDIKKVKYVTNDEILDCSFAYVDTRLETNYQNLPYGYYYNNAQVIFYAPVPEDEISYSGTYEIYGKFLPYTKIYISAVGEDNNSYISSNIANALYMLPNSIDTTATNLIEGKNYILSGADGSYRFSGLEGRYDYWVWARIGDLYTVQTMPPLEVHARQTINYGNVHDYFIFRAAKTPPPTCPACNGSGTQMGTNSTLQPCSSCYGSGYERLSGSQIRHVGRGPAGKYLSVELPAKYICPTCNGDGQKIANPNSYTTCSVCEGKGYINSSFTCRTCYGYDSEYCPTCGGTEYQGYIPCLSCKGTGKIYEMQTCDCVLNGNDLTIFSNNTQDAVTTSICSDLTNPLYKSYTTDSSSTGEFNVGGNSSDPNTSLVTMVWTLSPEPGEIEGLGTSSHSDIITYIPYDESEGGSSDSGGTGGGGDCLSADTLITLPDGSQARLDSLKIGDYVMDKNGNPNLIYKLARQRLAPHRYYYFNDGTVINEVKAHRFYNVEQGFYQLMQSWNIGEHALNSNGELIELIRVEEGEGEKPQYGIYTINGNYYANNLLSGQARCNLEFVEDMSVDKAINMLLSIDSEDGQILSLYEGGILE